jgi:hypothetical protein
LLDRRVSDASDLCENAKKVNKEVPTRVNTSVTPLSLDMKPLGLDIACFQVERKKAGPISEN